MEVDCGFQAVDFGGLVVDSGGFPLIAQTDRRQTRPKNYSLQLVTERGTSSATVRSWQTTVGCSTHWEGTVAERRTSCGRYHQHGCVSRAQMMSNVRKRLPTRYDGAVPWRQLSFEYLNSILYSIRYWPFSSGAWRLICLDNHSADNWPCYLFLKLCLRQDKYCR